MKKLMVIVLLLCSMCTACYAKLQQPTDDRWVILYPKKNNAETWIDIDSIEFSTSTENGHIGHKAVRIRCSYNDYSDDTRAVYIEEFDLECKSARPLILTLYDDEYNVIGKLEKQIQKNRPITPFCSGDDLILFLIRLSDTHKDKDAYMEQVVAFKDLTRRYKSGK